MSTSRTLRAAAGAVSLAIALALGGCGLSVPSDPDGTLESVRGGELPVGVSPDGALVQVHGGDPSGSVVDLVEGFADEIDASPEYTVATEETLVRMLEEHELDLVAGGFTSETPWVEKAGVSRGYAGVEGAEGRDIVMLVPLGENAFLSRLERYLDEEVGR